MRMARTTGSLALTMTLLVGGCGDGNSDEVRQATGQAAGGDAQQYWELVQENQATLEQLEEAAPPEIDEDVTAYLAGFLGPGPGRAL